MRAARMFVGVAVGVSVACVATPLALGNTTHRPVSGRGTGFAGRCQLAGVVDFVPPLTNAPKPARDYAFERGTCSGELSSGGKSASVVNTPVRYFATDIGQASSCAAGPDATGWGRLSFPAATIPFRLTETRISGVAQLSLTGERGGSAEGVASIAPSVSPVQIAEDCAGAGLRSVPVEISLQTTPEIGQGP